MASHMHSGIQFSIVAFDLNFSSDLYQHVIGVTVDYQTSSILLDAFGHFSLSAFPDIQGDQRIGDEFRRSA